MEVFYSYSHRDEALRDELEKHLSLLKWQGYITTWHDRRILAGQEWADEIDSHLNTAQIILLLISPDFLASEYCYSIEVKRAVERHERGEARVIPIILRAVYWGEAPFSKLQALPKDAKPITSWPDRDEAFFEVADGIRKAVEVLRARLEASPKSKQYQEIVPSQATLQTSIQDIPPQQVQKTKEQWIKEGDKFFDLKQYAEALEAYEQAIRLDPNDAFAYGNKGSALNNLKRYAEALEAYEQVIRLDPNLAALAYDHKGLALGGLNRYEEALAASEQALRLDPNLTDAYNTKSKALGGLNRYEEALAASEQALRLDPNLADAYNNKGSALDNLKRYAEALEAYEQALRLDPNLAGAYNGKGLALNDLNRCSEALEACEQAIRLDPNNAAAYNNKGTALYGLHHYSEALEAYEQALRLDPSQAVAYNNKGLALDKLNRKKEAQQAYEKARQL